MARLERRPQPAHGTYAPSRGLPGIVRTHGSLFDKTTCNYHSCSKIADGGIFDRYGKQRLGCVEKLEWIATGQRSAHFEGQIVVADRPKLVDAQPDRRRLIEMGKQLLDRRDIARHVSPSRDKLPHPNRITKHLLLRLIFRVPERTLRELAASRG